MVSYIPAAVMAGEGVVLFLYTRTGRFLNNIETCVMSGPDTWVLVLGRHRVREGSAHREASSEILLSRLIASSVPILSVFSSSVICSIMSRYFSMLLN